MTNLLLVPGIVTSKITLDSVYNILTSLYFLILEEAWPALDPWVAETAVSLTSVQKETHHLLFDVLYSSYEPDTTWASFPDYLEQLASQDPWQMRNRFLRHMFPKNGLRYAQESTLIDLDIFIQEISRQEFDNDVSNDLLAKAHALVANPQQLQETAVSHLQHLWQTAMATEWTKQQEMLLSRAAHLRSQIVTSQNAYGAIQAVTGRDLRGQWQTVLAPAKQLHFIPNPHIGPYLMHIAYGETVRIVFNGRSAPQPATQSAFDHAAFLTQLRTLADDTRLRILELFLTEQELYAQQVIQQLQLTKSGASRHLSQLTAAGFLQERQQAVKAKSYVLNPAKFREIITLLNQWNLPTHEHESVAT